MAMSESENKRKVCKNCTYWQKKGTRTGKCDIVHAMTEDRDTCSEFVNKHEARRILQKEQDSTTD